MLTINPADIEAIKARRPTPEQIEAQLGRPEDCKLSYRRAQSLTHKQIVNAWSRFSELTHDYVPEVKKRTDGTEIAVLLFEHLLDLTAFGISEFAGASPNPKGNIRRKIDEALNIIWEGMNRTLELTASEVEVALRPEYEAQAERLVAQERELMAATTDAAIAEAAAERRRAAQLAEQLKTEQQAHNKAIYDAQRRIKALEAQRAAPAFDPAPLHARIAELEAQLKVAQQPAPQPAPLEAIRMPEIVHLKLSPLETLSLGAYTRAAGVTGCVDQKGNAAVPADLLGRWRADVTDHRAYLRNLPTIAAWLSERVAEAAD